MLPAMPRSAVLACALACAGLAHSARAGTVVDVLYVDGFENTASLAVTKSGTGFGRVTSTPSGIDCGANCARAFTVGTPVTLAAQPDPDIAFTGWTGASCATGTPPDVCIFTLALDTTVDAAFALADYHPPCGNVTLAPGVHSFASITIDACTRVLTSGSGILELQSVGDVTIAGTIDLSGGPGGDGGPTQNPYRLEPGGGATAQPDVGGAFASADNGGPGGVGGAFTAAELGQPGFQGTGQANWVGQGGGFGGGGAGQDGSGGGGGYAGGGGGGAFECCGGGMHGGAGGGAEGGAGSTASSGGQGGGGSLGAYAGGNGAPRTIAISNGSGGGGGSIGSAAANDLAVATTLYPGSGGGGGGGHDNYLPDANASVGGGGGGAGGALRIASGGALTVSGQLLANGGRGGNPAPYIGGAVGGGGGGGSGGVIVLEAASMNVSGTVSVVGGPGAAGGDGFGNGTGGAGGSGGPGRIRLSVGATCSLAGNFAIAGGPAFVDDGNRCAVANGVTKVYVDAL